jgi:O-antigen ligase
MAIVSFLAGESARSSGAKGDPNSFAAYLLVAIPLVLVVASDSTRPRSRYFFFGTAALMVGAVMSTLSRGALLTLLVLIAAIAILPARRSLFRSRGQKVLVVAGIVVVSGLAFLMTASTFAPRLDSILTSDTAGSGRLSLWKAAVHSAKDRPILGLGYGAFKDSSYELLVTTPGVDLVHFDPGLEGHFAHSTYLETLAELGIPGLLLFLGVLIATALELRAIARIAHRSGATFLARVANALLIGLLAWSTSAALLSMETARPLWILIGMTLALSFIARREASTRIAHRAQPERDAPSTPTH